MTLEVLWKKLADITARAGMKCGRLDTCNSNCCRPVISCSEPGVTHPEMELINNFLAKQREFRFYESGNNSCKFLGKNDKCRIYTVRPIDCRVHFCKDDSFASQSNHSASNLVADYHARHEIEFMSTELIDSCKFLGEP